VGRWRKMIGWSKSCHHRRKRGEKQSFTLSKGCRKTRDPSVFCRRIPYEAKEKGEKIASLKVLEPCGSLHPHLWLNKYGPSPHLARC